MRAKSAPLRLAGSGTLITTVSSHEMRKRRRTRRVRLALLGKSLTIWRLLDRPFLLLLLLLLLLLRLVGSRKRRAPSMLTPALASFLCSRDSLWSLRSTVNCRRTTIFPKLPAPPPPP